MANEFIARKGLIALSDSQITGSLNISQNLNVVGGLTASFDSSTSTAISGAFTSVSSSIASERLKNTTDTLTGDLTVTGTITAQEFHTEFVSASIIYESGSTQFGNSSDDTHIFSGSALVSGSVGIGTSSPDNGLHVKDTNIHLQASNAKIKLSDFDNSMYLRMNNTGSLEVTDSNEVSLVHFNKNGKVGIGTNSPAELLHLYSVNNSGPEIRFQHPSGSHYIRAYDNGWNFLADSSVQAISIQNNGTTTFGANVLLGNTVVNPATGFADQSGIGLKESSTIPKIEVSSDDTALSLNRTTTGGAGVIADLRYESNVRHSFGTATSYMLGSVGIGSASPSSTLDVQTNSSAGIARISADGNGAVYSANGDVQLYTNDAAYSTSIYAANKGSLLFRVQNDGNVGIGTTSPQTHLDVVSSTHTKLRVRTTGVADASMEVLGYDAGVHIGDPTNGNRWAIWNDGVSTTSTLSFGSYALGSWYVPGSQVMTLTHDGNVGIGTTSPTKLLDVNGAIRTRNSFNISDGTTQIGGLFPHKVITGAGSDNSTALFAETGLDLHFMTNGSVASKMIIDTSGDVSSIGSYISSKATPLTFTNTGTGTYNKTVIYNDLSNGLLFEAAKATDSNDGTKLPVTLTWRGNYTGNGGLQLTGTTKLYTNNTGLGINTTSPHSDLHVEGDISQTTNSKTIVFSKTLSDNVGTDIAGFSGFTGDPSAATILVTIVISASSGYAVSTVRYLWNLRKATAGRSRSVTTLTGADQGSVNSGVVSIASVTPVALYNSYERFRLSVNVTGISTSVIFVKMEAVGENIRGLNPM